MGEEADGMRQRILLTVFLGRALVVFHDEDVGTGAGVVWLDYGIESSVYGADLSLARRKDSRNMPGYWRSPPVAMTWSWKGPDSEGGVGLVTGEAVAMVAKNAVVAARMEACILILRGW